MTKEYLENILTEYGVAFTDSLADRLLREFKPCEDCISRTEVIKSIDEREDVNGKVDAESVRTDIVLIPPVNPQNCDKCEVGNPCLYCKHEFDPQKRSGEK